MIPFKKWQRLSPMKKEYYKLHLEHKYVSPIPLFGQFIAVTFIFVMIAAACLMFANNLPIENVKTAVAMGEAMSSVFILYKIVIIIFMIVILCYSIWRIYENIRFYNWLNGK